MSNRPWRQRRRALRVRRLRRGKFGGVVLNQPALAFVVAPASSYQNNVSGPGAVLRLVDALLGPIQLPNVSIAVALPLGAGATLSSSGGLAQLTDATGQATWPDFKLQGVAGPYSLTFSASGYTPVTASGVQLLAGAFSLANSTAAVPGGVVGQLTTVTILPRDAQGNDIDADIGVAVTVSVAGSNTVAQTTVPYFAGLGYLFNYTPLNAGTDNITVKAGGTSFPSSPFVSSVSPSGGQLGPNSLRFGMWGSELMIGKGPAYSGGTWQATPPLYGAVLDTITPSSINARISAANAANVLIFHNIAGSKASYAVDPSAPTWQYDDAQFRANVQAFVGNATYATALAQRRVVIMLIDEPWIAKSAASYTPLVVRNMARYVKSLWPNCIITARMEPNFIGGQFNSASDGGWGGQLHLPANYFDAIDYMWATYRGPQRQPTTGMTFAQWVAAARPFNTALGYGTVWGCNSWNLGDKRCWNAANTGVSGRRYGADTAGGLSGDFISCATQSSEKYWMMSDAEFYEYMTAILGDTSGPTNQAPALVVWTHADPGSGLNGQPAGLLWETQPNIVAMLQDMIDSGANRQSAFQWRTPK
jgi:hypothetical protein